MKSLLSILMVTVLFLTSCSVERPALKYFEQTKNLDGKETSAYIELAKMLKDTTNGPCQPFDTCQCTLDTCKYKCPDYTKLISPCDEPDYNCIYKHLTDFPFVNTTGSLAQQTLISAYGFPKAIRKDFTTTVLGQEKVAKVNRYATLDLSEKPAFDFTPIVLQSNVEAGQIFTDMWSFNFSGKLNSDGIFKFKDWRELTIGSSWMHLWSATYYPNTSSIEDYKCKMRPKIRDLVDKYKKDIRTGCPGKNCTEYLKDLADKFLVEYSDLEVEQSDARWRNKEYIWTSVNANFLKLDNIKFTTKTALDNNIYKPAKENIYIPDLTIGLNYLNLWKSGFSLLGSVWAAGKIRHSFSEVFDPTEFQSYKAINSNVNQLSDKEDVFISDISEVKKDVAFDFGTRAVLMMPYINEDRKQQFGITASFSRANLISDNTSPYLEKTELGLVFPFLQSDGESTFNLEIFHRWDSYLKLDKEHDRFIGLRFNVPISSSKNK